MIPAHIEEDTIKRLHKSLQIPTGYYRGDMEPIPPEITPSQRGSALRELEEAGVIKGVDTLDVMDGMCRVLGKLGDGPPGFSRLTPNAQEAKNTSRRERIEAAIIAEPHLSCLALSQILEVSDTTVGKYKKLLRQEGRI